MTPNSRPNAVLAAAFAALAAVPAARAAINVAADYNFAVITSNAAANAAGLLAGGSPAYANDRLVLNGGSFLSDRSTPLTATTDFGLEVVCKAADLSAQGFVLSNNAGNFNGFEILKSYGSVLSYQSGGAGPLTAFSISPNVTYAFALVRSGTTNSLYANGTLVGQSTTAASPTPTTLTIGATAYSTSNGSVTFANPFVGSIKRSRLFTFSGAFNPADLLAAPSTLVIDTSLNNSPAAVAANAAYDDVVVGNTATGEFGQTGGTLSVASAVTIGNISGSTGTYTLSGGTLATPLVQGGAGTGMFTFKGGTLRATNGGAFFTNLANAYIGFGNAVVDTNGFDVTLAKPLLRDPTGGATVRESLTKTGNGTLTLTGDSTYRGTTTVNGGTLKMPGNYVASNAVIAGGATLELAPAVDQAEYSSVTFTGTGTLRKTGPNRAGWGSSSATFALGGGALIDVQEGTFTGGSNRNEIWTDNKSDLNVAANATFAGVEANVRVDVLSGNGTITTGFTDTYQTFTAGVDNGSGTFAGTIADTDAVNPGKFTKIGTGTQTFTGNNTYTGGTTINAGTVRANNAFGSATGSEAVTVNSGGTLGGSGTIANGTNSVTANSDLTVNSGGTITAGESDTATGKLTTGRQRWNGGGRYAWKLANAASTTAGTAGSWDLLSLTTLDLRGLTTANKFTIAAGKLGTPLSGLAVGKTFLIADLSGAVSLPSGTAIASLFVLDASALVTGSSYSPQNFELSFAGGDVSIVYTAAPEPGTIVLGGLALSPLVLRRRARREA